MRKTILDPTVIRESLQSGGQLRQRYDQRIEELSFEILECFGKRKARKRRMRLLWLLLISLFVGRVFHVVLGPDLYRQIVYGVSFFLEAAVLVAWYWPLRYSPGRLRKWFEWAREPAYKEDQTIPARFRGD